MRTSEQGRGRGRGEDVWNAAEEQGSNEEQVEQKVKCQMSGRSAGAAALNAKVTTASGSTQPHSADK